MISIFFNDTNDIFNTEFTNRIKKISCIFISQVIFNVLWSTLMKRINQRNEFFIAIKVVYSNYNWNTF